MIDADGDGLISFKEYIFFQALLQIPAPAIETAFRMFDSDGSGAIDRGEFLQMMNVIESRNPLGESAKATVVSTSAATQRRKEDEKKSGEAETAKFACFFGADGSQLLDLGTFRAFVLALHEGVLEVEFHRMDTGGKGLLTAEELALSITSHCNPKAREEFVAKATALGARHPTHLFSLSDFKQASALAAASRNLNFLLQRPGGALCSCSFVSHSLFYLQSCFSFARAAVRGAQPNIAHQQGCRGAPRPPQKCPHVAALTLASRRALLTLFLTLLRCRFTLWMAAKASRAFSSCAR